MNFHSNILAKVLYLRANLVGTDIALSLGSQKGDRKYKNAHHDGYVAAGA